MNNSMEQRFVDRLLHTLAAPGEYGAQPPVKAPVPAALNPIPAPSISPISR